MRSSQMIQRLAWKSTRQALPLVTCLIVIAAILLALTTIASAKGPRNEWIELVPFLVPILFSVGAGTTLISVDRESKSLQWLQSLPVTWTACAVIPILMASAILTALWGLAYVYTNLAAVPITDITRLTIRANPIYFVAHSYYLLICGFTAAWMVRSPLFALITIMPLAAIPAMLEYSRYVWKWLKDGETQSRYLPDLEMEQALPLLSLSALAMTGVMALLARHQMLPRIQSDANRTKFWQPIATRVSQTLESLFPETQSDARPLYRKSALLWGFYRQNRWLFRLAQVSCVVFATSIYIVRTSNSDQLIFTPAWVALLLTGILIMVLPTLTFGADTMNNGVAFLAGRGIRPSELWWSRQLTVLGLAGFFVVAVAVQGQFSHTPHLRQSVAASSWPLFLALTLNAYAIGQWIGQVVSRITVAIFTTLVVASTSSSFIASIGPLLWVVPVINALMLMATYQMTQSWMERRTDLRYWLRHTRYFIPGLLLLLTIFLVPITRYVPYFYAIAAADQEWLDLDRCFMVIVFNAYALSQGIGEFVKNIGVALLISTAIILVTSNLILVSGEYFWLFIALDLVVLFAAYGQTSLLPLQNNRWQIYLRSLLLLVPVLFVFCATLLVPSTLFVTKHQAWNPILFGEPQQDAWQRSALPDYARLQDQVRVTLEMPATPATSYERALQMTIEQRTQVVKEALEQFENVKKFHQNSLVDSIESQLQPNANTHFEGAAIQLEGRTWFEPHYLVAYADRLSLEVATASEDHRAVLTEQYIRYVDMLVRLTQGLKKSNQANSLALADLHEIWLIRQCLEPQTFRIIPPELFDEICELVGNPDERWLARRRSVQHEMGNIRSMKESRSGGDTRHANVVRFVEQLNLILLKKIEAELQHAGGTTIDHVGMELPDFHAVLAEFEDSNPGYDWIHVEDARLQGFSFQRTPLPFVLWGAGWERQGQQLRDLATASQAETAK